jgi:hypothetical protein
LSSDFLDLREVLMSTKSERIAMRLTPELYEKVKALAAEERRSISNMLCVLVEEAIAARDEESNNPTPSE